jgi:hypothetical protein
MYRTSFTAAFSAFSLLTSLLLVPSAAWSERPQCLGGLPPDSPDRAVCFAEEPFNGIFYESPLSAPEEMVLFLINDKTDDFVRAFPDGRLFVHTPEREGEMIWCPFSFAQFLESGPTDLCVFGTATLQANGYIERSGDLGCPYVAHLRGTGLRGSDTAAFEVSSDMLLVPSIEDPSGCSIIKDYITSTPVL